MQVVRDFLRLSIFPLLFVTVMWFVHMISWATNDSWSSFGVYPRTLMGTLGILVGPMIHGDLSHLVSNSFPILILGPALYYGYRDKATSVLVLIYLLSGFLVWLLAREAYHIGASGVVYGLFGFVFCGGLLSDKRSLSVIGLSIFILYGGIFHGVLPGKPGISWESHLYGLLIGVLLAIVLVKPRDNHENEVPQNTNHTIGDQYEVRYHYSEGKDRVEE